MAGNTETAPRRALSFASFQDISAECDRLEAAHLAGKLKANGNWSPGEIFHHLSIFVGNSLDGFPPEPRPPAWLRWIGKTFFLKKALTGATCPPGIKLPDKASFLLPRTGISFDDGLAEYRRQLNRVLRESERMIKPSPLFGELTHDNWIALHRGHAALHLGFLDPGA